MSKKTKSYKDISRREFLKSTVIGTTTFSLTGCSMDALISRQAKKPNILLIFDDQHRYSALGCYGNNIIKTPNINRLAEEGVLFENAFSCSPICSPFRAQLHTGKYAHKNGVVCNEYKLWPGQITLPRALKNAGYHTGYVGKLHLGYGPYNTKEKRLGYDYMSAYNNCHDNYKIHYYENGKGMLKVKKWAPIDETTRAIKFLQEHKSKYSTSPFFLALSWAPPHWGCPSWDYAEYPEEFKIYKPSEINIPPNVPKEIESLARKEIANYYGTITALDAQVGRILDALDKLKFANNTIVVFTSDHGDHLSSHGYGKPIENKFELPFYKCTSKATPYNESIHIPLIIKYPPEGLKGIRADSLISSVDIMPTLLGLCGVRIPDDVQGDDLSHVVLDKDGIEKDSVYLQILGPGWPTRDKWVGYWRGVRTKRWVYARWLDNEYGPVLFDCKNDPYEMNNLAGKQEYGQIQERLEKRLKKWMKETDDPFETGKRDKKKKMLMLGQEFSHKNWLKTMK
ncbi:MAG: sulfatase family protein [Planctomycetota bacterium]|jgi:arylsulfatase A-like enzyme